MEHHQLLGQMRYVIALLVVCLGLSGFALFNSQKIIVHKTVAYGLSPQTVAKRFILFQAQINEQAVQIESCYTKHVAFAHVAVSCKVLYDGGTSIDIVLDLTHSTWEITPGSQ